MIYQILLISSIVFMILGVILGLASFYVFRKQNMAEIYDSFYNRGYTQKIENRRKKREQRRSKERQTTYGAAVSTAAEASALQPKSKQDTNANVVTDGKTVPIYNGTGAEQTTVLNPVSVQANDETTILEVSDASKDFIIVKELYYAFSNETI